MKWRKIAGVALVSDRGYGIRKSGYDNPSYTATTPERKSLGLFKTSELAKAACEQHLENKED